MNTCKTYGIAAAALAAALVCTVAVTATAADGDIWSIRRASGGDYGLLTANPSMSDYPLTAGQKVYFKFRLLNRDPQANIEAYAQAHGISPNAAYAGPDTWNNMWQLLAKNPSNGQVATNVIDMVNATNFPAKVGVWVSGRCQWADIERVDLATDNYDFTDIICSYTAQPGDFGLLTLAAGTEAVPVEAAAEGTGASSYLLKNSRYWGFFDSLTKTNACRLWLTGKSEADVSAYVTFPSDDTPRWVADRDMSQAGIYIRTIDFDNLKFNDDVWRRIAANGTSSYINEGKVKRSPTLTIPGAVATDRSVTLYAWTEDETVAYMKYGAVETFVTNGVSFTRRVVRIPLAPEDGESVEIPGGIFAMGGATNKTTRVFLSATPTNIFRSGVMITNFVTKTILVGPPEPPSLVMLAQGESDYTATAGSPVEIVPISVTLEGVGDSGYTSDLTVEVTAEMIGSALDPQDFVGLSVSSPVADPKTNRVTVTIPKPLTSALVYAYVKRAKINETTADDKGIKLKATVDADAQTFFSGGIVDATLHIKPSAPKIASPAEDATFPHVPGGNEYTFRIAVDDAPGEMGADAKYTVYWSNSGNGIYATYSNLTLVAGELLVPVKYMTGSGSQPDGFFHSQLKVVNQDDFESDVRTIKVQVDEPRVISLTADRASRQYAEGDTATITLSLSEQFSTADTGYLFLVPQDANSSNLVECTQFTSGELILSGDTAPANPITLKFLDNSSSGLRFMAVLRSRQSIEEGDEIGGFTSRILSLSVTNKAPRVSSVYKGTKSVANGGAFAGRDAVAKGVTQFFRLGALGDVDADRTNANFMVEWAFEGAPSNIVVTGSYTNPVAWAFSNPGTNTVTVKVKDKDMASLRFEDLDEAFTFYVEVLDEPTISLVSRRSFYYSEKEVGQNDGLVEVRLNIAPPEDIVVKIDVVREGEDDGLTSEPVLSTNLLPFTAGTLSKSFFFKELDGGASFIVRASVTNETQSVDPNKTWAQYYRLAEEPMTVVNDDPIIRGGLKDPNVTFVDTNPAPASIGVPAGPIAWEATDVLPDIREGMTASWTVENATIDVPITTTNTARGFVGGSYSPTFTSAGLKVVTLTVKDKNGGSDSRRYYFTIEASKELLLYPQGPRKRAISLFSSYYISAAGLGAGRVWAGGGDPSSISNFEQLWTLSSTLDSVNVYGYGYRVGEEATGALTPGRDFRLDVNGNLATNNANLYKYPDTLYDSFFYCWILDSNDKEGSGNSTTTSGNFTGAHLGAIQPAVGKNTTDIAAQPVGLPAYDEKKVQYERRYVEGIFSKEYFREDNVGDINQDGIPDIYAASVAWSGQAADSGTSSQIAGSRLFEIAGYTSESAGDLKDLRGYNGDYDYLPTKTSAGGTLIPGISSEWATYGEPFNAYLELRGWGDGLNYREDTIKDDPDHGVMGQGRNTGGRWISEKSFSELEMIAYSNAWEKAKLDGTTTAATLDEFDWTPENRTDPTISDTDGDGLPDGFEYYLWYRAYVGYFEYDTIGGTNIYKRLTGSRFRLNDIGEGTPITPEEVAEAFNPNSYASNLSIRDTDNDGLTDLEEFAMGTNPIHWDTDGDGISDYWEVIRGLNPLYAEKEIVESESNPDGDFMAKCTVGSDWGVITFAETNGVAPILALAHNGSSAIDANTLTVKAGVTNVEAILVFRYGGSKDPVVPRNRGIWKETTAVSGYTRYECDGEGAKPLDKQVFDISTLGEVKSVSINQKLMLIHEQVRAQYGFDPRTGWYKLAGVNLVNARWNLNWLGTTDAKAGTAVNTEPYRNLDEYLLLKYRYMTTGSISGEAPEEPASSVSRVDPISRNLKYDLANLVNWRSALVTPGVLADKLTDQMTLADIFLEGTTNPNLPYTKKTYGDYRAPTSETSSEDGNSGNENGNLVEFTSRIHGADTDCDGVPDGWELYVGFDPNDFYNQNNERDGNVQEKTVFLDPDKDRLSLVEEYAGTDSCNAYSNAVSRIDRSNIELDDSEGNVNPVATIYENHPGNKSRWFNKFWPTDPWDADTDGDHISDKLEGSSWGAQLVYHRVRGSENVVYPHTFIYKVNDTEQTVSSDGNELIKTVVWTDSSGKTQPVDDGYVCIRGGGLNPCTVDTDFDLLPDPWEMEFAGILFSPSGLPANMTIEDLGEDAVRLMRRSDGLTNNWKMVNGVLTTEGQGHQEALGYYVSGGMDGTFGCKVGSTYTGDAFTSGEFSDERTGTNRDYDFDHDGLQNFQEYLVQALRHLRYDDSETPLMGRWMPGGDISSEQFIGFLPMNVMDGETFYKEALKAGFSGSSAWNFSELGYFARPPRQWDAGAMRSDGGSEYDKVGFRYMLPPHGLDPSGARLVNARGYYASTDPRMWDTDSDGMDDYYELFHGLNPLLGSIKNAGADEQSVGNAIDSIYYIVGDVIANLYYTKINNAWMSFWNNAWRGWPGEAGKAGSEWLGTGVYELFDPIRYPWMMGSAEADADGDGIRNAEEALIPNIASPQPTHTDPTPLWFTDSTARNKASYTSQYYLKPAALNKYWAYWLGGIYGSKQTLDGASSGFLFSFEENEGYDTDHDWISDGEEQRVTSTPQTDSLVFSDPDRRQAIWFPGDQSAAVSRTDNLHPINYASYDFLRQFTVEAWIKPDDVSRKQVILERACWYGASTLSNNLAQVRANFLLGIREDGYLYGLYDTSDAVASELDVGAARVVGLKLATNEWTHIALTFNGKVLNLYMNGTAVASEPTTAIPANGVVTMLPDAYAGMLTFPILENGYDTVPSAMVMGAKATGRYGVGVSTNTTWDAYTDFYAGYLDEVRVWDGARSMNEILGAMRKRYSFADVSALRDEVCDSWKAGATRSDNTGKPILPPELVMHYNFQTLPGAADPKHVAWEPSGFTKNVKMNGRVDGWDVPGDIYCGWWYDAPVRSTVYTQYRVVPWIQNTVAHLPPKDGSTIDSRYWSEFFGGMTLSNEVDVSKIEFPNTANPYPYYLYTSERYYHKDRLERMARLAPLGEVGSDADVSSVGVHSTLTNYLFEMRSTFVGFSDLVPLGGAFAKRGALVQDKDTLEWKYDMWDANGPMDAWEYTRRDTNANGIPDWWEKVAVADYGATAGFGWDAILTWEGREMTAREAYIRDLQRGMMPTGLLDNDFVNIADSDNDGIPDWWEDLYGIRSQNGLDDADNDQLSNYAEYLISECFSKYGFRHLSPLLAQSFASDGQEVPDYFLKVGKLYLGEMFADHDFMEDAWEDQFDPDFVSRFKFDAWADPDNDGWSNWAECRADTDPTLQSIAAVDGYTVAKYPVPDLVATIVCDGDKTLDAPIYVQAYPSSDTSGMPDAVWQIGSSEKQKKYLGMNPNSVVNVTLGSGSVQPGTVIVQLKSSHWIDSEGYIHYLADAAWVDYIHDTIDTSVPGGEKGILFFHDTANTVGSVNYATGAVTIDFTKCRDVFVVGQGGSNITYFPDESFFVIQWNGVVPNASTALTMHLRDPLPAVVAPDNDMVWKDAKNKHPSRGAVREGRNTFVAFLDLDSNGTWTPGEPYGVTPDIYVGWSGTAFTIELTDTAPQMMRINLRDAVAANDFETQRLLTDRGILGYGSAPNSPALNVGTNMPLQTERDVRVRIALDEVNGRHSYASGSTYVFPAEVVFDKRLNLAVNPLLTEKNLFAEGMLDLEWGTIGTQAERLGINAGNVVSTTYRIVLGDGAIATSQTNNNSLAVRFKNVYDSSQPTCSLLSPKGAEYSQPTFTWKCNSAIGKAYPAFRLRVYTASSGGTLIYDSGNKRAPARNSDGSYSWTAPIYPDMMTPNGKIFATTNNYFWTVSMLDAKFTSPLSSQGRQEFRLEASGQLGKISDYGMLKAKVRYFGPGKVATGTISNLIHVQAFTSPDFTGMPAGEARVTNVSRLSSVGDIEPNAVILGLKPGTYYVRAFIDTSGDSTWANSESWGYGNYVGAWDAALSSVSRGQVSGAAAGSAFVFTPRPYTVALGEAPPVAEIYIEDMDTDNDYLPDIYEYNMEGRLSNRGAPTGPTFFTKVNTNLATTVKAYTKLNASSSGQTYAPITLMNALISGSDMAAMAAGIDFFADSSAAAENVSVRIDSFSLADGLSLSITPDVQAADANDLSVFVTTDSANVKVVLVASDSPDFANAKETVVKTITIKANIKTEEGVSADELRAAIDAAGLGDAAFFKVKLEQ